MKRVLGTYFELLGGIIIAVLILLIAVFPVLITAWANTGWWLLLLPFTVAAAATLVIATSQKLS